MHGQFIVRRVNFKQLFQRIDDIGDIMQDLTHPALDACRNGNLFKSIEGAEGFDATLNRSCRNGFHGDGNGGRLIPGSHRFWWKFFFIVLTLLRIGRKPASAEGGGDEQASDQPAEPAGLALRRCGVQFAIPCRN